MEHIVIGRTVRYNQGAAVSGTPLHLLSANKQVQITAGRTIKKLNLFSCLLSLQGDSKMILKTYTRLAGVWILTSKLPFPLRVAYPDKMNTQL
ncbi:hypothetical protein ES705_26763 [subsurface metagenome]